MCSLRYLKSVIRGASPVVLLKVPAYYATQAEPVRKLLHLDIVTVATTDESPEVIARPEIAHLNTAIRSSSMFPDDASASTPSRLFSDSSSEIDEAWKTFITQRETELIVISSLAFTFIMWVDHALKYKQAMMFMSFYKEFPTCPASCS